MLITIEFDQSFDDVVRDTPAEPLDFVYSGHGVIKAYMGDNQPAQSIGAVRTSTVDGFRALDDGVDPFLAADDDSVLLGALYADLFDLDSGDLREAAVNALAGEPMNQKNILVIEQIALRPAFRGYGIAPHVVRYLTQRIGRGVGICALFTRPLQFYPPISDDEFGGSLGLGRLEPNEDKATDAVRSYFARHGFRGFSGSQFMVRSMDFPLRRPAPIDFTRLEAAIA